MSYFSEPGLEYFQGIATLFDRVAPLPEYRIMGHFQDGGRRLERRRSPRFAYRANLQIEWGSAVLRGRTRDISLGGLYIEADDLLWVGAGFRARMDLGETVHLDCSVRRVEPGRGMGVTIELPGGPEGERFTALLERLARPTG